MSTTTKAIIAAVIAVLIIGGVYYEVKVLTSPSGTAGTSPQGGTTSTAHFYSVAVQLGAPGANATSSSVLNSSPNDYYVTSIDAGCEKIGTSYTAYSGAGLAALLLTAATSSTAAPAALGSVPLTGAITIPTSTPTFVESSTTASGGSSSINFIWPAGTYMSFSFNATNTAACTVGVKAFSS